MYILTLILLGSAPFVQLPAGDYTICNTETKECLGVSGGHQVTVEADKDEPRAGAPRGVLLAGGVSTGASFDGRIGIAFGEGAIFVAPRGHLRRVEHDNGWYQEMTEVDLGVTVGIDSGTHPWFFALGVDIGAVLPFGDESDPVLYADSVSSVIAPDHRDLGVNAALIARVGCALGERLFVAVDTHLTVAVVEHGFTHDQMSLGVRGGLGWSF